MSTGDDIILRRRRLVSSTRTARTDVVAAQSPDRMYRRFEATVSGLDPRVGSQYMIGYRSVARIDILLRVNSEESHGTAPLRWVGILRFAVYHLCPRLESSGEVMKVDSRLCQPAGTPIFTQTGRRLGVTFCVIDVETDVLGPIHVRVERRIAFLADVQPAFNALTLVFSPTAATRLARVTLRYFHNLDTLDLRLVRENRPEAVKRPAM